MQLPPVTPQTKELDDMIEASFTDELAGLVNDADKVFDQLEAHLTKLVHLSPEQRLQLLGELCESLEAENVPLSPAWKTELDQRSHDLKAGNGDSIPLAQAMDELRSRNR